MSIDDRGNFQKFNVSLYEIFPKLDLLENKVLKERIVTCFEDTLYIIIIFINVLYTEYVRSISEMNVQDILKILTSDFLLSL